jgi:hypothetical protein
MKPKFASILLSQAIPANTAMKHTGRPIENFSLV